MRVSTSGASLALIAAIIGGLSVRITSAQSMGTFVRTTSNSIVVKVMSCPSKTHLRSSESRIEAH
jgi:hypothetical protein